MRISILHAYSGRVSSTLATVPLRRKKVKVVGYARAHNGGLVLLLAIIISISLTRNNFPFEASLPIV